VAEYRFLATWLLEAPIKASERWPGMVARRRAGGRVPGRQRRRRRGTTRAWMNALAPAARPVFAWNHHVIMRWGGKGIARLLRWRLLAFR
jgi:hypothetical protein